MSAITTHVLDTSIGRPAQGVRVQLEAQGPGGAWAAIANGISDADGRVKGLLSDGAPLAHKRYRLVFDTAAYFAPRGIATFFPCVEIGFEVASATQHYHVPLLLSPYGYSTYRGS